VRLNFIGCQFNGVATERSIIVNTDSFFRFDSILNLDRNEFQNKSQLVLTGRFIDKPPQTNPITGLPKLLEFIARSIDLFVC